MPRSSPPPLFSTDTPPKHRKRYHHHHHSSNHQQHRRKRRPQQQQGRDPLHQVLQSIKFHGDKPHNRHEQASPELLQVLDRLARARHNQRQVHQVGRQLEALSIVANEAIPIQERVVKAVALVGLLDTGLALLEDMMMTMMMAADKRPPSDTFSMAYIAVCNGLRRARRKDDLEQLLLKLGDFHHRHGQTLHVVAWNVYLASMCDSLEDPGDIRLQKALDYVLCRSDDSAAARFHVQPDLTSYNTVLGAAAKVGNRTVVGVLWEKLANSNNTMTKLEPDICSYNALLSATDLPDRVAILQEIESEHSHLIPDRYTLDLVMLPLIQEGQIGHVESLLDTFIRQHSGQVVQDAFGAFLSTLVDHDEWSSARALLDNYVLSEMDSQRTSTRRNNTWIPEMPSTTTTSCAVRPTARHFNILLAACRRRFESAAQRAANVDNNATLASYWNNEQDMAQQQGQKLYRIMVEQAPIQPDPYTLTSMMGLATTSEEILNIMAETSVPTRRRNLTPAVVRAAMTACGKLGDPSVSCRIFDTYLLNGSINATLREWNVLLGAIAEGCKQGDALLDLVPPIESKPSILTTILHGQPCSLATFRLLQMFQSGGDSLVVLPVPTSQTFCIVASAIQYYNQNVVSDNDDNDDSPMTKDLALQLFQNATSMGIGADGRLVNAIFRCFGDDVSGALVAWKTTIRPQCLAHEQRNRRGGTVSVYRSRNKNLIAAYNGLLHVSGRALRPDIALRLAYAMNREQIEPNEVSLHNYQAGKRLRNQLLLQQKEESSSQDNRGGLGASMPSLLPRINMVDLYENLLYVECTKYDQYDKRMANDRRVRIIV